MTSSAWAQHVARTLLAEPLPRRWAHVQGVAAASRSLAPVLGADAELVTAAAWLHDIGYAPVAARTGLHPLDGARYLRDSLFADDMTCRLVAHHSGALAEAAELGLDAELAREFEVPRGDLLDALIFCDMTTSPDGMRLPVGERLAEIRSRYEPAHPVSRAIARSAPEIIAAVTRTSARLAGRTRAAVPVLACAAG
jgi:putative nucleotidyltransferase with HDIG domain